MFLNLFLIHLQYVVKSLLMNKCIIVPKRWSIMMAANTNKIYVLLVIDQYEICSSAKAIGLIYIVTRKVDLILTIASPDCISMNWFAKNCLIILLFFKLTRKSIDNSIDCTLMLVIVKPLKHHKESALWFEFAFTYAY